MDKAPLGVGQGGSAKAFAFSDFKNALDNGGEYVCCANFRWLDWKWNTSPGVPVLRSSVAAFAESPYPAPQAKFDTRSVVVCVDDVNQNPLEHKGALQAASPQEELLAPIFTLGHAVLSENVANSDAQKWLSWMQTTLFTFKLLPTREAKEFETITIRQKAAHKYHMISYTPVQWVYKIMQMKKDNACPTHV